MLDQKAVNFAWRKILIYFVSPNQHTLWLGRILGLPRCQNNNSLELFRTLSDVQCPDSWTSMEERQADFVCQPPLPYLVFIKLHVNIHALIHTFTFCSPYRVALCTYQARTEYRYMYVRTKMIPLEYPVPKRHLCPFVCTKTTPLPMHQNDTSHQQTQSVYQNDSASCQFVKNRILCRKIRFSPDSFQI